MSDEQKPDEPLPPWDALPFEIQGQILSEFFSLVLAQVNQKLEECGIEDIQVMVFGVWPDDRCLQMGTVPGDRLQPVLRKLVDQLERQSVQFHELAIEMHPDGSVRATPFDKSKLS